jgi:hypothetical protein
MEHGIVTLLANHDPVDVVLTIGTHCYCLRFGDVSFKADKTYLAKTPRRRRLSCALIFRCLRRHIAHVNPERAVLTGRRVAWNLPRVPVRLLLAILSVALLVPASAMPARPAKACIKKCKPVLASCTREVRAQSRAARQSCSSADRAACRRTAKRVFAAGKRTCRGFRQQCQSCCRSGSANCDLAPEVPRFSGSFPQVDRTVLDTVSLPPGPNNRGFMLVELPDGSFSFDPQARSPVSAAAECASVVLDCFEPTLRNWTGCFASVPTCTTETPWVGDDPMCCPAACSVRYQELRREGRPDPEAFAAAIWEEPSCMPGLVAHPRETTP